MLQMYIRDDHFTLGERRELLSKSSEEVLLRLSMEKRIEPHHNDVLLGRGGKNNKHEGNETLRGMARAEAHNYFDESKNGKTRISAKLVQQMKALSPPARFLRKNDIGMWEDASEEFAREKVSQVLRDAVHEKQRTGEIGRKSKAKGSASVAKIKREEEEEPTPNLVTSSLGTAQMQRPRKRRRSGDDESIHEAYPVHERIDPIAFSPMRPRSVRRRSSATVTSSPDRQLRRPSSIALRQGSTASHQSLLGDFQEDTSEFDLFNGELLEFGE